jgi:hypothetical protein
MPNETPRTRDNLVSEKSLLGYLGVKRSTLDAFRRQGLPVVSLDKTHRAYWRCDVEAFLAGKRALGATSLDDTPQP